MRILVTGATGFVGSHLVRELCRQGNVCRCLVRNPDRLGELADLSGRVELFQGDVTDRKSLRNIARGIDVVYHLAAQRKTLSENSSMRQRLVQINVLGTENILRECLSSSLQKFVHFSSTAAMGFCRDGVLGEDDVGHPESAYGKSKLAGERLVQAYVKERHIPAVILRPCAVYGPGGQGVFLKLARLAKQGMLVNIGRGKNYLSLIFVADVVRAAILAGTKGNPGEVYLIAPEIAFDFDEIRTATLEYFNIRRPHPSVPVFLAGPGAELVETLARIFSLAPWVGRKEWRSIFQPHRYDISRAKTRLGFSPADPSTTSLRETLAWFRQGNLI